MRNRFGFLLIALCACFSLNVAGEVTQIYGAGKLRSVLNEFHVPRGHIKLDQCTSDDKRPMPGFIKWVSLNFNEHIIAENGSIKVNNVFETLVPTSELSGHPSPSELSSTLSAMSISSFTTKNLAIHGIRSVTFNTGEGHADVKLHFYDMNHQLLLEREFSCPWDGAIKVVY